MITHLHVLAAEHIDFSVLVCFPRTVTAPRRPETRPSEYRCRGLWVSGASWVKYSLLPVPKDDQLTNLSITGKLRRPISSIYLIGESARLSHFKYCKEAIPSCKSVCPICVLSSNVSDWRNVSSLRVPVAPVSVQFETITVLVRMHKLGAAAWRLQGRGGGCLVWEERRKIRVCWWGRGLSLWITITKQVKRDKCQRTLGEIKQQLACTRRGKAQSEPQFVSHLAPGPNQTSPPWSKRIHELVKGMHITRHRQTSFGMRWSHRMM